MVSFRNICPMLPMFVIVHGIVAFKTVGMADILAMLPKMQHNP